MIVYPSNWKRIGRPINVKDIEKVILLILANTNVNYLSLSGGIDSSLILYYMVQVFGNRNVYCYTMALNEQHPDYIFSKKITKHFNVQWQSCIPPQIPQRQLSENGIVKYFYNYLKGIKVDKIVAGDGIDEYMCGYYEHQDDPTEETYFKHLRHLQERHLNPLHKNSDGVSVYLPFLDDRLVSLLSQIPITDKVNAHNRKKIVVEMAKGKLPDEIIQRRKYGFNDVLTIKE